MVLSFVFSSLSRLYSRLILLIFRAHLSVGFGVVAAVAERFVGGFSAAAKGDAVSGFIQFAVGSFDLYASADPDWTACTYRWIFNQADRRLKNRFDGFPGLLVPND